MGAITSAIASGIGLLGGAAKAIGGGRQRRKYRKMIENYQRQDLRNLAQDIQLNTMASDLAREDVAGQQAGMVDALSQGGSRNLIGGIGKVSQAGVQANREALSDLNQQDMRRQYAILNDAQRVRQMQEQREMQDLAGMGAMYNAGNQDMWGGIGDVAQSAMYYGRQVDFQNAMNKPPLGGVSPNMPNPFALLRGGNPPTEMAHSGTVTGAPNATYTSQNEPMVAMGMQTPRMPGGNFNVASYGNPYMTAGYNVNQLYNYGNPVLGAFGN